MHVFAVEDVPKVWAALRALAESTTHATQPVDEAALWSAIEPITPLSTTPRARVHRDRNGYLDRFVAHHSAVRPLADLDVPEFRGVPLREVRVARMVRPLPAGDGRSSRSWEPLATVAISHSDDLYVLVGGAGQGKSEAMGEAPVTLAIDARSSTDGPIPIWTHALDLGAGSTALPDALSRSGVPRVVFIDGFDEVDLRMQQRIESELSALLVDGRTVAVVVATRLFHGEARLRGTRLELSPWTPSCSAAVLESLTSFDAARVHAWRQNSSLLPFATSPLTLTLSLRLPLGQVVTTHELYQAICRDLFIEWAERRADIDADAAPERWEEVRGPLGELALDALAQGRIDVTEDELRQRFSIGLAAASGRGKRWTRAFGLLSSLSNGHWQFALRALAEHLAGEALARRTVEQVVGSLDEFPPEVVRQACGLLAVRDGDAFQRVLQQLILPCTDDFHGEVLVRPCHIRRVVVLAGLAADLGDQLTEQASQIAGLLTRYIVEETSTWVGTLVADAVQQIPIESPVWCGLRRDLTGALGDPSPHLFGVWEAQSDDASSETWMARTLHRCPSARAAAINADRVGLGVLLQLVWDDTGFGFDEPPALDAARALRAHPRTNEFLKEALPRLQEWLGWGLQVLALACATALRPGEVPAAKLIQALHPIAGNPIADLTNVLEELHATDEGRESLAAMWPEWRESCLRARQHSRPWPTRPGPSFTARGRICSVLRRGPEEELWPEILRQARSGVGTALEAVTCHRESMQVLLNEWASERSIPPRLPHTAQRNLGHLLVESQDLRSTFDQIWNLEQDFRTTFLGHALEPLLAVDPDDDTTAHRLGQWLAGRGYGVVVPEHARPSQGTLEHPIVRAILIRSAAELIDRVRTPNAEGTRLWPPSMIAALADWWPSWVDESNSEALVGLLDDESAIGVAHLLALSWDGREVAQLRTVRDALFGRIQAADRPHTNELLALVHTVIKVSETQMGHRLIDVWQLAASRTDLEELALAGNIAIAAASHELLEAAEAGARVAAAGLAWHTQRRHAHLAVRAAPDAFVERAMAAAEDGHWLAVDMLSIALPYLEPEQARAVVNQAADSIAPYASAFGWRRRQELADGLARPLDLLDRARFEAGLPIR